MGVDEVAGYIHLNTMDKAAEKLEQFWARYSGREGFIEKVRSINETCWQSKHYDLYFSICRRVVEAFPVHPLSVGMLADEVAGYAIIKETEKSLEKLNQLWEWYRTAPDFVDKLLNIKKLCWWNESYELHFAICERIAQEFPDDAQTIQVRADEVTGYLARGDMEKAEALVQRFLSEPHTGDAYVTFVNPVANTYNLKGFYQTADALYQYALDYADADDGRLAITKMGQLASRIATTDPNVMQQQFDRVLADYADDPNVVKGVFLAAEVHYFVGQKRRDADAASSDYTGGIRLLEETLPKMENDHDRSEAYYIMGLYYWQLKDWLASASALMDSVAANSRHQHAGSMHWMISSCYERLQREGAVSAEEVAPVIEWGYQTLFEEYPNSRDVEYAAIRLIELNLARGKPVSSLYYIHWFLNRSEFDHPQREQIIQQLIAGMEGCDQ